MQVLDRIDEERIADLCARDEFFWLDVTAPSKQDVEKLHELFGFRYGGSSGTNLAACLQLATGMRERGEQGSIVSLLCDRGERYEQTLFDPHWLAEHDIDPQPLRDELRHCVDTGQRMASPMLAVSIQPA